MISCIQCANPPVGNEFALTWVGWAIILIPILMVGFIIGCWLHARHREDRAIAEGHPEQAYYQIGNVSLRKSTVHAMGAGYIMSKDVMPHLGDPLRIPPHEPSSHFQQGEQL